MVRTFKLHRRGMTRQERVKAERKNARALKEMQHG